MTQTAAFDPVPSNLATLLEPAWLARALSDIGGDDRIVEVEELDTSRTLAAKVRFRVTVEDAQEIVQRHLKGGEPVERLRFSVPD